MDFTPLISLVNSLGLGGLGTLIVAVIIFIVQYRNGNVTKGINLLRFGNTAGQETIEEQMEPRTAAFHSASYLVEYLADDPEGLAAATKCGERVFSVKPPVLIDE